ncbi:hypothetical protein D7X33_28760 [Butyricicoccus sp. 1XD8-22]|nr:hypothetical protein D7X33_28760 [Butyricicoccus sp. 1XD8-22]
MIFHKKRDKGKGVSVLICENSIFFIVIYKLNHPFQVLLMDTQQKDCLITKFIDKINKIAPFRTSALFLFAFEVSRHNFGGK